MIRRVILSLLLVAGPAFAAQAPKTYLLQDAATATGGGTVAHAIGFIWATVQIVIPTGASPSAVLQFEQTLNRIHYTATLCRPLSGNARHSGVSITPANASTADLHWRCDVSGAHGFRVNITSYTGAGAITVYAVLTSSGVAATMGGARWS